MILGHIGARKGSKGVVGKNFRPIAGKPLIDWSLDQLFRNKNIDAVVVSVAVSVWQRAGQWKISLLKKIVNFLWNP